MSLRYFKRGVFKALKKDKWIFYLFEYFKWHREIEYQKQVNRAEDLKPQVQIRREERLVRRYWRLGTFHYYRYGLQYKQLTEEQLLDYVPTYYFHKCLERHHEGLDTIKYGDKLEQARLFEERGIPTSKVLAVVKGGDSWDIMERERLDIRDLIESKLSIAGNKLFFKPTGNCGGAGILVLKRGEGGLLVNGQEVASVEAFLLSLNKYYTYVVEENIIQHPQLSQINPSSVNTLRVVVQREEDRMQIKTCILRMGRLGKEVDNSAQGGISIKVDVATGELDKSATAEHGGGDLRCHPDTGYVFEGSTIEDWDNVRGCIEVIANKLLDFNDIALDIALTPTEAILVEFNFRYGVEHQQCVLGGVRQLLNISNR